MKFPNGGPSAFPLAAAFLICGAAAPAQAAWIPVTVNTETQLQQAFAEADLHPENTYSLSLQATTFYLTKPLVLTKGVVNMYGAAGLAGSDFITQARNWVLDGRGVDRVIRVDGPAAGYRPYLSLRGISIRNGMTGDRGGGANVRRGYLSLTYCIVAGNKSTFQGAGIYAGPGAYLTLSKSLVEENINTNAYPPERPPLCAGGVTSTGGGIFAGEGDGTAIAVDISQSTIRKNIACRGGGVAVSGQATGSNVQFYITNSSIGENIASGQGGGVYMAGTKADVRILHSTIAANKAGMHANTNLNSYEKGGGGMSFYAFKGILRVGGMILARNQTDHMSTKDGSWSHDCLRGGIQTTAPSSVQVNGNRVGRVDKCTFFGSPYNPATGTGWDGIGSETYPFDPELQPVGFTPRLIDTQSPWGTMPVFLPSYTGGYSKSYSPGNYRYISCPEVDQVNGDRDLPPEYCSPGAIEFPYTWGG